MPAVIGLGYFILIIAYVLMIIFVDFHLRRYSIDHQATIAYATIFTIVSVILLVINVIFFANIPFADLVNNAVNTPSLPTY